MLAPDLGGERARLLGLAMREMHRGEHGHAGGALRRAVLEIGRDHVGRAALDEENLLHAPLQKLAARPIGVLIEESAELGGLAVSLPQAIPVEELACERIRNLGLVGGGILELARVERLNGRADMASVRLRERIGAQRRDDLIEARGIGRLAVAVAGGRRTGFGGRIERARVAGCGCCGRKGRPSGPDAASRAPARRPKARRHAVPVPVGGPMERALVHRFGCGNGYPSTRGDCALACGV